MAKQNQFKLGLMIVGVILAITLIWQNRGNQSVYFLFAEVRMPVAGLLISTLAIGFVLGYVTPSLLRRR